MAPPGQVLGQASEGLTDPARGDPSQPTTAGDDRGCWEDRGCGEPADGLRWLDAPPADALRAARDLLRALGALDAAGRATPAGAPRVLVGTDAQAEARVCCAADCASPPATAVLQPRWAAARRRP